MVSGFLLQRVGTSCMGTYKEKVNMARHTAFFGILLLLFYLSFLFITVVSGEQNYNLCLEMIPGLSLTRFMPYKGLPPKSRERGVRGVHYENFALNLYHILNLLLDILPTKEKQEKNQTLAKILLKRTLKPFLNRTSCIPS